MKQTLKNYYILTKPGIVRGNAITALAGFFFGLTNANYDNMLSWLWLLIGVVLVVASGCVLNNIFDKKIDAKMPRTKKRPLISGAISMRAALVYSAVMLAAGETVLYLMFSALTAGVALFGWVTYSFLYTFAKRYTEHGTLIGAVPGATPPVIGYVAATNQLDLVALTLFAILVAWQMPHFYAIAIYRKKEYQKAKIPVWSVVYGNEQTRRQILAYGLLFLPVSLSLWLFPNVSYSYLVIMSVTWFLWMKRILPYPKDNDFDSWARKVFGFSLIVLLVFSLTIALNSILP